MNRHVSHSGINATLALCMVLAMPWAVAENEFDGLTDPIAVIVSFYGMVEAVARGRGINPDTPRHLSKVTETV